ncbi:hypothetical protein H0H93_008355 [Arthromyces matolae]|nr:hypothetical protein H0H93_008355 [Arthromyces matolae]
MSVVQVRVELPAYAHSFTIQVPSTSTIADVKQEIFNSCPGKPRVTGQRIIWRGRYLVDHEKVEELWKLPDELRTVHLAVHSSAWTSTPPEIPTIPTPSRNMPAPSQRRTRRTAVPNIQAPHPLSYILFLHQMALASLSAEMIPPASPVYQDTARSLALQVVQGHGWEWPAILDQPFPLAVGGGLQYQRVTLNGQDFLSLTTPSAKPSPLQVHALKVLSYTFTLLSIPLRHTATTIRRSSPQQQQVPIPPDVNALLQQLGAGQIRVAPNADQNPANPNPLLPDIPLRPLLAPMLLLLFRTVLLLYFVAPARKPIFGVLIIVWMVYEIWRPIRDGILRGLHAAAEAENQQNHAPADQPAPPRPDAPNVQPNAPAAGPQPPQNGAAGVQVPIAPIFDLHAGVVLDTFANVNVTTEERILNETPGVDIAEFSLSHKVATFLSLLLTTVHPAIWNTRRVALRQREGRIRTEANVRETPVDENEGANRAQARNELQEQYNRRPRWIRDYIERVVAAEWVDDSD